MSCVSINDSKKGRCESHNFVSRICFCELCFLCDYFCCSRRTTFKTRLFSKALLFLPSTIVNSLLSKALSTSYSLGLSQWVLKLLRGMNSINRKQCATIPYFSMAAASTVAAVALSPWKQQNGSKPSCRLLPCHREIPRFVLRRMPPEPIDFVRAVKFVKALAVNKVLDIVAPARISTTTLK